ncbi:MAG: hypothetical protein JXR84_11610 [Anaerolineae bacterium]|nr:hypothetical protein [Anaerolineae bacterium]
MKKWPLIIARFISFIVLMTLSSGSMNSATASDQTIAVDTQIGGIWNLGADINVSYPSGYSCNFLNFIGDPVIPVNQSGNQLTANDVDTTSMPFILQGTVNSNAVTFTITGLGISPGDGGCSLASQNHSTTYIGIFNPTTNTIQGSVSGSGQYSFEFDDDGNHIWQLVTWNGTFTVSIELPKIQEITVQGMGTANDIPETGSPVRLAANIEMPTGYEVTRCSWTGELTPGEGDPANNCRYEYTPATGSGPALDTYGEKKATLTVALQHTPSGVTGQISKDHTYKVFFEKEGDDDGDCHWWHFWEACEPNWFEYWGDDGAVAGLNAADVRYDSTCPTGYICYGAWRSSDDIIYVQDGAAEIHYPGGYQFDESADCPGGNFGGAQGIDCAAEVLAHERRHETIYHNWDSASSDSCGSATGPWSGCTDSDTATTHGRPGDDLPDDYESVLGTAPNTIDSCDVATVKDVPSYAQYGDNEFDAMQSGDGAIGNSDNDWANPGKQTPTPFIFSVSAQNQRAELGTKSGPAGHHAPSSEFSIIAATTLGSLTGDYSDTGVDTDGNGFYNSLKLSVGVHIDQTTTYSVDRNGPDIRL